MNYQYSLVLIASNILILSTIVKQTNAKYNILLVLIDDLRYRSEDILLPNLDRISKLGVNFKNAFAQQALCAPSRNSLLTGRRPDTLRLYDFNSYWRDTVGNFTTLPQFFKERGYDTYSIGKVFHPGQSSNFSDDYPYSWSYYPYHPPTEKYKDAAVCKDKATGTLKKNLICPVSVAKQPGKTLPDIQSLKYAVSILKKHRSNNKSFFLAVGFHKPHIPLKFPKKYLEGIPIHKITPPNKPKKPVNMPSVSWHPWTDVRRRDDIKRLNISFPFGTMPAKWTLKIKQSYYAASKYIDDLIGDLIDNVDLRTTIVISTSDHGWSLGENGLWAKYSNFDVALNVPLIFMGPGLHHKTIHTPVELIDIFPTVVQLAGFSKVPECPHTRNNITFCLEGKSLIPLMGDQIERSAKGFAISQYPRPSVFPRKNSDKPRLKDIKIMGYSIRTKRYRYTEWISFNNTLFTINWNKIYGLELYDHTIDPNESNNIYLVPKYKYIKKYLSKLLRSEVDPNYLK